MLQNTEGDKSISPTLAAFRQGQEIYTSFPSSHDEWRMRELNDGTHIDIIPFRLKPRGTSLLRFHIAKEGSKIQSNIATMFRLNRYGLVDLSDLAYTKVEIGDFSIVKEPYEVTLSLNNPEMDQASKIAFREGSVPLIAWVATLIAEGHYSPPPITFGRIHTDRYLQR